MIFQEAGHKAKMEVARLYTQYSLLKRTSFKSWDDHSQYRKLIDPGTYDSADLLSFQNPRPFRWILRDRSVRLQHDFLREMELLP